ncbi:exonuclease subunit SbcD [Alkalimonas delamerensis]|uniref:Nuclease SbcCD subunit D n=1 Tax=Alkalimonas delamerensis TaxID=265981 RepID=A0ABT9GRH2_9GAMM|nr:exonuclease subunit SbcD [Alkalimonas delamerensis]MDP4529566.1 exonuclease subunit SbcD [Alkalimonas delamerensis]
MKIIHTSDWHLGQSFFTKSRKAEHQAFLHWLLAQAEQQQVDAILVAGDVFDTGTPPSYARELYNEFVVACNRLGICLVVLGGNHDSVSVLNESRQLLACLNTYVVASVTDEPEQQLLTLPKRDGSPGALLCAVPFVRPRDVLQSRAGDSGLAKRQALGTAISQHYQQLYQLALTKRQALAQPLPIVATGHLSALGVSQSESVRDIYIGTLDGFAADAFPPADYIALGHIHRPQIVGKKPHIRYSGSPIPLSFDELGSSKQVLLVQFADDKLEEVTPLEVPRFQPMALLKGNLSELEQQLSQYPEQADQPTWLSIEVTLDDYLPNLQQRIQALCDGKAVDVLQLRRARSKQRQSLSQQQQETLTELTPQQVFERRLALEHFDDENTCARKTRLEQLFTQILDDLAQGDSGESPA